MSESHYKNINAGGGKKLKKIKKNKSKKNIKSSKLVGGGRKVDDRLDELEGRINKLASLIDRCTNESGELLEWDEIMEIPYPTLF